MMEILNMHFDETLIAPLTLLLVCFRYSDFISTLERSIVSQALFIIVVTFVLSFSTDHTKAALSVVVLSPLPPSFVKLYRHCVASLIGFILLQVLLHEPSFGI